MDNLHLLLQDELEASPAVDTPPTRDDAIQQRVHELDSQAQSYLGRPTNANYKQAIGLYERILGFGDINPAQRASFERRLEETIGAYEQFRAQFGELTTARQIQRDEIELIELRKLINTGVEIGPDGEELEPQFDKLLATVREKLLRVGRELADQANKQAADGADYLDPSLLDTAINTYEHAIRYIQGEEIRGWEESTAANIAIMGIKSLLLNEAAEGTVNKYEQRAAGIRDTRAAIQRIRPLYDEADRIFRQGDYAQTILILESAEDLAGKQFSSALVEGLRRRAAQRWEQATLAQADALLHAARMAASRGEYDTIEKLVGEVLGLEPHLESDGLQERRRQAQEMIKEIHSLEEYLQQLVSDSGLARVHGRLEEAEQRAREALVLRPGHRPAQQALESALVVVVNTALRHAQDGLATPDEPRLQAARENLELQRQHVDEISDPSTQRHLNNRLEETLALLKHAIEKRHESHEREQQAKILIDKARQQALQERFADALATVAEARALVPQNTDIEHEDSQIRAGWAETLRGRARALIEADPPHPAAALECLATLRDIGMQDTASIELRRRVDWQATTTRGLSLLHQGVFAEAIEALKQGDLGDEATRSALRDARCKEAQRLMSLGRWTPALEILQQIDGDDPDALALISRARAEYLLDQAQGFLNVKVFNGAESKLLEAEREPLPDLTARIGQLREQINTARTVFRKVQTLQQRAQDQYRRYRSYNNPGDLLEAIRTLDEALDLRDLPAEDRQRDELEKLRNEYQQRYQELVLAERTRLLSEGDAAMQDAGLEHITEAIQRYRAVLELSPDQEDTEAISRMERARQLLRHSRDKLVDETGLLLNLRGTRNGQRGIRLADVQELIASCERAQQLVPETHRALNEARLALREAARAYETADADVQAARAHWAAARRDGSADFSEVDHALQRAVRYFEGVPYIHGELDRNNPDSLVRQINANREMQRVVVSASAAVSSALARFDGEAAGAAFAELARAEEAVYATSTALAGTPSGAAASESLAERYPHQYAILSALSDRIKEHMQREREAPDVQQLREIIQQRIALQRLLERLDRDDRFGLR